MNAFVCIYNKHGYLIYPSVQSYGGSWGRKLFEAIMIYCKRVAI